MLLSKISKMFRNKDGLTLLELMIAVFILALIAMGLFQAFTAAFQTMNDAKERTIATNYAQQILEEYKNMHFSEMKNIPHTQIGDTKYFRDVTVDGNDEDKDLKEVIVTISWTGMNNSKKSISVETKIYNEQSIAGKGAAPEGIVIYANPYNILPGNDPENRDIPSHIYAEIVDKKGDLIIDWNESDIYFSIISATDLDNDPLEEESFLGNLSDNYCSIVHGRAETFFDQYPYKEREGYVTIKASLIIDGKEIYDTVTIRITNDAISVILTPDDDKYVIRTVGGDEEDSIAHLTAEIVDAAGGIVKTDREVVFDIIFGPETSNLINYVPNDGSGIAKIDLKAGSMVGTNTVKATAILLEAGIVDIEVVEQGTHKLTLKADRDWVINGRSTTITATLKDYLGIPVGGKRINFEITNGDTLGRLSREYSFTEDESGEATTTLTMDYVGTATVTAEWEDENGDIISATVDVECGNPALYAWYEESEISAGEYTIYARLTDPKRKPLEEETIIFSIIDGMDSGYFKDNRQAYITKPTEDDGIAEATLTIENCPSDGFIIVKVEWEENTIDVNYDLEVECTSEPVYKVVLSANKTTILENETLDITAIVTKDNSPLDNVEVTFKIEGSSSAKLDNQSPTAYENTDENGEAIVTLSGLTEGESVIITANVMGVTDSITIKCEDTEVQEISIVGDKSTLPRHGTATTTGQRQVYFVIKVESGRVDLEEMKIEWTPDKNEKIISLYIDDDQVYKKTQGKNSGLFPFDNTKYKPYALEEGESYEIKLQCKSPDKIVDKNWTITFINPIDGEEILPPIKFKEENGEFQWIETDL